MKRLFALLCNLLAALGLNACDYFNLQELKPGVSTAMEVRERFGPPAVEWHNEDGSVTWEYSRQPQGSECYMMTIGPDNVLRAVEQVLNEKNFARIQAGMNGDEVRRVLGAPGSRERFELSRETVWNWRIASQPTGGDPVFFSVHFNDDGRVVRTSRNVEYRG
ncbi:hypothetical protein [Aromatoleum diolicum]|uniref:Tyrosinase copper-binding domain-containing protein n=1 Tax=Aromatoleum diolicum TaxID=75796 RepID=A0ABX1QEZ7_9RHOO|nr:hypothetical protein [Aromatoleum diolicum]NMG75640.1 hypothetical protein [Aromatoleum diolicum]